MTTMRENDAARRSIRARVAACAGLFLASVCVSRPAEAQCAGDADCKGGRRCVNGACIDAATGCNRDKDCPGDEVCNAGACGPAAPAPSAAPPSPTPVPSSTVAPPASSPLPPASGAAVPGPAPPPGAGPQPFFPGSGQPTGTRTESKPIAGLYIPGIITLGVGYLGGLASSIAGTASFGEGRAMLGAIPIAGPWIVLGVLSKELDKESLTPLPIVFGALQAIGLTMTILGFAIQTEEEVPTYARLGDSGPAVLELGVTGVGSGVGLGLTLRGREDL